MFETDALTKSKEVLKRFPYATPETEWYDDDTHHCTLVYVDDKGTYEHAQVITAMVKAGFNMFDFETMTNVNDVPWKFSAVYSFDY